MCYRINKHISLINRLKSISIIFFIEIYTLKIYQVLDSQFNSQKKIQKHNSLERNVWKKLHVNFIFLPKIKICKNNCKLKTNKSNLFNTVNFKIMKFDIKSSENI